MLALYMHVTLRSWSPSVPSLSFARFADGTVTPPPVSGPDPPPPSVEEGVSSVNPDPAHPPPDPSPGQPPHAKSDLLVCLKILGLGTCIICGLCCKLCRTSRFA